jgi:predicted nucleic acid-binding protein
MYVVDASVLVSRFLPEDAFHEISSRWLDERSERLEGIFVPSTLPAEVGGALARRTGQIERAAALARGLFHHPSIRVVAVDAELGQEAATLAAELRLRGADAVYVALARRLGMPLVTWDAEQRERARSAVRVATPEEGLQA